MAAATAASPTTTAAAAVAAAEAGDFAAAVELFQAALKLQPDEATWHEQLAQCLLELDQYDAAVAAAQAATTQQPAWPVGWVTLARACRNVGDLQTAQVAYAKTLELDPGQPEVHTEAQEVDGLICQQLGRLVGVPGLAVKADPLGRLGPGCVIWEAGVQLARLFVAMAAAQTAQHAGPPTSTLAQQELVPVGCLPRMQGARVLEVGAGTGIAGITAAALGAQVTLTDLPELQPLLEHNLAVNQGLIAAARGSATAAVWDWGRPLQLQVQERHWDWAGGADLVFNEGQVQVVVGLLAHLLCGQQQQQQQQQHTGVASPCCSGFLLAHKHRHDRVDRQLMQALAAAQLRVRQVRLEAVALSSSISVWWVTSAGTGILVE